MSIKSVIEVINKATQEEGFKKKLIENPDEVLSGFDLSDEERARFRNISSDTIAMYKNNLDKRVSKGGSSDDEQLDWWIESVTD